MTSASALSCPLCTYLDMYLTDLQGSRESW